MLKMDSYSGVDAAGRPLATFEVKVPQDRRAEQTRLEVRYSPTLAGAMVDALPYLIDYPYGCTEQTLNRFLPAVITQQTLLQDEARSEDDSSRSARISTHRKSATRPTRTKGWKRYDHNPVFNEAELTKIVKAGVNRLQEMQLCRRRLGLVQRLGRTLDCPHDGDGRARPANREAERCSPGARRVGARRRVAESATRRSSSADSPM